MKIFEVVEAKKLPIDDVEDSVSTQDADQDSVPNILMQMRKAIDVDGNYEFKFADGSKHKLEMPKIAAFIKKYMTAKPQDKERLQDQAIASVDGLLAAIKSDVKANPNKSIYNTDL